MRSSAEETMRQRLTDDDSEQCGAALHGDQSSGVFCLARKHDDDQAHLSIVDAPELDVTDQLIQWNDALITGDDSEEQANQNGHTT